MSALSFNPVTARKGSAAVLAALGDVERDVEMPLRCAVLPTMPPEIRGTVARGMASSVATIAGARKGIGLAATAVRSQARDLDAVDRVDSPMSLGWRFGPGRVAPPWPGVSGMVAAAQGSQTGSPGPQTGRPGPQTGRPGPQTGRPGPGAGWPGAPGTGFGDQGETLKYLGYADAGWGAWKGFKQAKVLITINASRAALSKGALPLSSVTKVYGGIPLASSALAVADVAYNWNEHGLKSQETALSVVNAAGMTAATVVAGPLGGVGWFVAYETTGLIVKHTEVDEAVVSVAKSGAKKVKSLWKKIRH